jgi:hypothetical protein
LYGYDPQAGKDLVLVTTRTLETPLEDRVDRLDWNSITTQLDQEGFAITPPLLGPAECDQLSVLFETGEFRSTVDMARHRFGDGRYRYFDYPLPGAIAQLRASFYRGLAPVANSWARRLDEAQLQAAITEPA